MSVTLSICIPVYNFGKFIPETLQSILRQDGVGDVEVVVVDGASTDDTAEVMGEFQRSHANVKYVRLPAKGGIDRDMAKAVEHSSGDYFWLFSGDDIMRDGALAKVRAEIESGCDVYLCKHMEYYADTSVWKEYPIFAADDESVFELSDKAQRLRYFRRALNTEAFFSFMGSLVVKRSAWNRVPLNEDFVGSCWAHAARMFELIPGGLKVKHLAGYHLDRRPDNDSFSDRGMVNRIRISIEGYHKIANSFFGRRSVEAYHIRRVVKHEFHLDHLLLGKFMCDLDPNGESRALMDRLARLAYSDFSLADLLTKLRYATTSPSKFRHKRPELCRMFESKLEQRNLANTTAG